MHGVHFGKPISLFADEEGIPGCQLSDFNQIQLSNSKRKRII